jgi:hypothetical protein
MNDIILYHFVNYLTCKDIINIFKTNQHYYSLLTHNVWSYLLKQDYNCYIVNKYEPKELYQLYHQKRKGFKLISKNLAALLLSLLSYVIL